MLFKIFLTSLTPSARSMAQAAVYSNFDATCRILYEILIIFAKTIHKRYYGL